MLSVEFKNQIAIDLTKERKKRSMTQKQFGKLTETNPKTVHKRESHGINDYIELIKIYEKLGYDPEKKLKEIREVAKKIIS